MRTRTAARPGRTGITLTEILIGIMILGIGLISLATLFPIGLLRLREAQRQSRSAYLGESVAADIEARNMLSAGSFAFADNMNYQNGVQVYPIWFANINAPLVPFGFDPLIQDAGSYGPWVQFDPNNPNPAGGLWHSALPQVGYPLENSGLPFAYDPLWRFQTGIYLDPVGLTMPEARFAAGNTPAGSTLRLDSDGNPASAWGLQRLTNFNRANVMPSALQVPNICVSPEDVVWNEIDQSGTNASPVLPDLRLSNPVGQPTNDWRFSWMITAQQNNAANGAAFDGNIVVFENRPFAIDNGQVAGETVVEGVFGAGSNVVPSLNFANVGGYAAGANRTVLLRWFATQPDPIVKVGDWIADVTYERSQELVNSRFYFNQTAPTMGAASPFTLKWDNLPAQRCFWYQVQRVTPPQSDPALGAQFRSMTVYVNRDLEAKTLLGTGGVPVFQNAALICPYVVNVIPQSFFVR